MHFLRARFYDALTMIRSAFNEAVWRAVLRKDRRYDGRFVYAATTTGIYCRPSCPARNPERRNALVYSTAEQAERQGYVACLRCHPNTLAPAEQGIRDALDYIEAHPEQAISLAALSRISGLSPHHFHETFQRIVGVSPKAFSAARRMLRFRECLRAGQSISEAYYEVGYGSSRAVYERARTRFGMTPGEYQRGAEGIRILFGLVGSRYGVVLLAGTKNGICTVLVGDHRNVLVRRLREEYPNATLREHLPQAWRDAAWRCQRQDPFVSSLPINMRLRIFQANVIEQLYTRTRQRPDQTELALGS